jgi:hypothetical protein
MILDDVKDFLFETAALLIDTITKYYLPNNIALADTKKYDLHIKPVCMIFHTFTNLIQGGYLIINHIITDKKEIFKGVLKNIVYLQYSIKVEDYHSYIIKTVVVYDIIKILFCDYINYIELDDKCYFDTVMCLLEEGIDSLYVKCVMSCHNMVIKLII